jgi:hypothetical protein
LIRRSIVDSKKWRLGKNNKRREQGCGGEQRGRRGQKEVDAGPKLVEVPQLSAGIDDKEAGKRASRGKD